MLTEINQSYKICTLETAKLLKLTKTQINGGLNTCTGQKTINAKMLIIPQMIYTSNAIPAGSLEKL